MLEAGEAELTPELTTGVDSTVEADWLDSLCALLDTRDPVTEEETKGTREVGVEEAEAEAVGMLDWGADDRGPEETWDETDETGVAETGPEFTALLDCKEPETEEVDAESGAVDTIWATEEAWVEDWGAEEADPLEVATEETGAEEEATALEDLVSEEVGALETVSEEVGVLE